MEDQPEDFSAATEDSDESPVSDEDTSWISWFCGLKGNEFFCEVEEDFIADEFNLSGLSSQVPYYDYALSMILDADTPNQDILTVEQTEYVESAAEMLYGMIHQRYILTTKGLSHMLEKFRNCDFGRCPRVGCNGQACLPVGTSDQPRVSTVKVFCPKCEDIYYPRSYYQGNLDGAFFGTTFPHLLLLSYPAYRPAKAEPEYVPKVFGFKLHPTAYGNDKARNPFANEQKDDADERDSKQGARSACFLLAGLRFMTCLLTGSHAYLCCCNNTRLRLWQGLRWMTFRPRFWGRHCCWYGSWLVDYQINCVTFAVCIEECGFQGSIGSCMCVREQYWLSPSQR
eukprot:TRINITY_DN4535_c0_g1_i1.p2 TRINITY_DN4535_c0_g1~~TRINITY_DN4535_c0_g1_i1.p2  ORF type:complete len:341 (-),score=20.38 TRINITY_DN4535_c0_g1_i1:142-1164(-)